MEGYKYAYSALPELLAERSLTVAETHERLLEHGYRFDRKTLYRLASGEPLQTINAPVLGALCAELNVGLGELLVWEKPVPKLHRIDPKTQARLDELMSKNTEGQLTPAERRELSALGAKVERLSIENARMLAEQAGGGKRASAARRTAVTRKRKAAAK